MSTREQEVLDAIFQSLQTLNEERDAGEKIDIGPDTCLFGEGSDLDSLSLVSVIVDNFSGTYSQQVRVVGATEKPASLPYRANMTLLDAMIAVRIATTEAVRVESLPTLR